MAIVTPFTPKNIPFYANQIVKLLTEQTDVLSRADLNIHFRIGSDFNRTHYLSDVILNLRNFGWIEGSLDSEGRTVFWVASNKSITTKPTPVIRQSEYPDAYSHWLKTPTEKFEKLKTEEVKKETVPDTEVKQEKIAVRKAEVASGPSALQMAGANNWITMKDRSYPESNLISEQEEENEIEEDKVEPLSEDTAVPTEATADAVSEEFPVEEPPTLAPTAYTVSISPTISSSPTVTSNSSTKIDHKIAICDGNQVVVLTALEPENGKIDLITTAEESRKEDLIPTNSSSFSVLVDAKFENISANLVSRLPEPNAELSLNTVLYCLSNIKASSGKTKEFVQYAHLKILSCLPMPKAALEKTLNGIGLDFSDSLLEKLQSLGLVSLLKKYATTEMGNTEVFIFERRLLAKHTQSLLAAGSIHYGKFSLSFTSKEKEIELLNKISTCSEEKLQKILKSLEE